MSYTTKMFVHCPSCNEKHTDTTKLDVVGIHEGDRGQDVLEYVCPTTKEETEATVYRGGY